MKREYSRLTKWLLRIFFVLSIFIVYFGLNINRHQAESPERKFGQECVRLAETISNGWVNDITFFRSGSRKSVTIYRAGRDPKCRALFEKYNKVIDDPEVRRGIDSLRAAQRKRRKLWSKIRKIEKEYSSMLLEKVAGQDEDKSILSTNADKAKEDLEQAKAEVKKVQNKIELLKPVSNYKKAREFLGDPLSRKILGDYEKEKRFYYLRVFFQIGIFLLPVWVIFYFISRKMRAKGNVIVSDLASFVAKATALVALIELVKFLYMVLPHTFLEKIIGILIKLNLGIVFSIIGIFFFIFIFYVVIKRIQKKNIPYENVKNGKCWECGVDRRSDKMEYCFNCGAEMLGVCEHCGERYLRHDPYCSRCGEKTKFNTEVE